jgi:hypothetical protein
MSYKVRGAMALALTPRQYANLRGGVEGLDFHTYLQVTYDIMHALNQTLMLPLFIYTY